jgi:hypothetical protein
MNQDMDLREICHTNNITRKGNMLLFIILIHSSSPLSFIERVPLLSNREGLVVSLRENPSVVQHRGFPWYPGERIPLMDSREDPLAPSREDTYGV